MYENKNVTCVGSKNYFLTDTTANYNSKASKRSHQVSVDGMLRYVNQSTEKEGQSHHPTLVRLQKKIKDEIVTTCSGIKRQHQKGEIETENFQKGLDTTYI